jgi:hypothetical protein
MTKKISVVKLGGSNIVENFSVKKNRRFMILLLKTYRLLLVMRLFKVKIPISLLQENNVKNHVLNYREDLRFVNFNGILNLFSSLNKNKVNNNLSLLFKPLSELLATIRLKKSLFIEKSIKYIYNKRRKKPRVFDTKKEEKKAKLEKKKKLGVIGRRLLRQKPLVDEIKNLKPTLLKLFQYIDQRKGFIFKRKVINLMRSKQVTMSYIYKKFLSIFYYRRFYINKKIIFRRRRSMAMKGIIFSKFLRF